MRLFAVVPAWNESSTIGPVVSALVKSRQFTEVVVVSDGSVDATIGAALWNGAKVLELQSNGGKGAAFADFVTMET